MELKIYFVSEFFFFFFFPDRKGTKHSFADVTVSSAQCITEMVTIQNNYYPKKQELMTDNFMPT